SGAALNIQNCVIRGFTGEGLNLVPSGNADINVSNTIVSGDGVGILLQPSGTSITVTASFEQVQVIHNLGNGLVVNSNTMSGLLRATAADSLASGNGGSGFFATGGVAAATFAVTGSKATNNLTGVFAGLNSTMFLNGSTVSGNNNDGWFVGTG